MSSDITFFAKSIVKNWHQIKKEIQIEHKLTTSAIKGILYALSPEETGEFRRNWKSNFSVGKMPILAESKIYNKDPAGPALEFGSAAGERPWPNAREKTTRSGGRIWSTAAGVDGYMFSATDLLVDGLASEIADKMMTLLKNA